MPMSDDPSLRDWAMERIRGRTEPEPDDVQHVQADVWTSVQQLKADASKTELLERDDVSGLIDGLARTGDVITWHGLVAPADEEHVSAIVETEARAEFSRGALVAQCNRVLAGGDAA